MSELVKEAFERLYPEKEYSFFSSVRYSGRFKPYSANVRRRNEVLEFGLSRKWKGISRDILIGLIQSLLIKLLGGKRENLNIDLYNTFLKNIYISSPKTHSDAGLAESFSRVNDKHFYGIMDAPNLRWAHPSRTKLASYDYHTDTISVSSVFRSAREEVIDYLVYHELLHRKLKFSTKNGRTIHHSREFRQLEKSYANGADIEREISAIAGKRRGKFSFLRIFR